MDGYTYLNLGVRFECNESSLLYVYSVMKTMKARLLLVPLLLLLGLTSCRHRCGVNPEEYYLPPVVTGAYMWRILKVRSSPTMDVDKLSITLSTW